MKVKVKLYNFCLAFINQRLLTVNKTISNIQNSLQSETKSSAGDKHETGRAMLQLEREKAGHQLAEIQKQREILNRINIDLINKRVALGSLVYTSQYNYFIAISAGEIIIEGEKFYAISLSTPIAKLLLSKKEGDIIDFRNSKFSILDIE